MNHRTALLVLVLVSLVAAAGLEYGLGTTGVAAPPQPESVSTPPPDQSGVTNAADSASATIPRPPSAGDDAADDGRASLEAAAMAESPAADTPLQMRVVRVKPCGSTCRDVTADLYNDGTRDLTNVEVYTTIYAGDEIVWVDAERVGTVAAGDTYTTTKRVRVGAGDVLKIHSNGGAVTIETVLESDQGSEVLTEQIEVV